MNECPWPEAWFTSAAVTGRAIAAAALLGVLEAWEHEGRGETLTSHDEVY